MAVGVKKGIDVEDDGKPAGLLEKATALKVCKVIPYLCKVATPALTRLTRCLSDEMGLLTLFYRRGKRYGKFPNF
jgi:hypothetical protein